MSGGVTGAPALPRCTDLANICARIQHKLRSRVQRQRPPVLNGQVRALQPKRQHKVCSASHHGHCWLRNHCRIGIRQACSLGPDHFRWVTGQLALKASKHSMRAAWNRSISSSTAAICSRPGRLLQLLPMLCHLSVTSPQLRATPLTSAARTLPRSTMPQRNCIVQSCCCWLPSTKPSSRS